MGRIGKRVKRWGKERARTWEGRELGGTRALLNENWVKKTAKVKLV